MEQIKRLFPELTPERMAVVVGEIVDERNFAAVIMRPLKRLRWGCGCSSYEQARLGLKDLAASEAYPWLKYVPETGQAYTLLVGGTPIRVQSESDKFRPVMPAERQVLGKRGQVLLPGFAEMYADKAILRFQVHRKAAQPVERARLYLFDEASGSELDTWALYQRTDDKRDTGSGSGNVRDMRRDAETPEDRAPFDFLDSEAVNDDAEDT